MTIAKQSGRADLSVLFRVNRRPMRSIKTSKKVVKDTRKRKSGRADLNRRPHGPEPCALPVCATPRTAQIIPELEKSVAYLPIELIINNEYDDRLVTFLYSLFLCLVLSIN